MKKELVLIIMVCSLFIMFGVIQSATATNFVNENWDSGTPPAGWACKNAPGTCPVLSFNGWSNNPDHDYCSSFPGWVNTGLSKTQAHSGSYSFYTHRDAGTDASCDIRYDLSQPYPTKIYIRFYLWLDSDFINFNTPTTREPSYHFLFTNSAQSLTGLRINLLSKVPWVQNHSCGAGENYPNQPYAFWSVQDYDREWPVGTYSSCYNLLAHLNQWQCTEFMMDATNKTVTVWMNGAQVYTATDRITQTNFNMIQLSNYMSQEGGTGFSTSYYVDDVVVSNTPIGCGGSGSPAPPFLNP